ncbi:putative glycosyl transferase [Candidatus Rickettsiella viridis]|uniref:Putative glycosyl transferase n=1 Tax=Candidatus Rickettsiella viridis TaxID=676208 RepID=A0A2Z5UWN5_9COXI|nr:glycosyltransferase family 4 protein [Candidatus Rickettsiella viridis]BBB15451.1 putative glycosyl transferase [Candidatus Rickettsiella viridis]
MRLLFCNFHEANGGGQDSYLLSLIKTLQAHHSVALACPPSSRLYLTLQQKVPCFAINYKALFRQGRSLFKQLYAFKQWVEKQAIDIIHVNGSADHRAVLLIYPFLKHRPKLVLTKHNALRIKWGAWLRMRYFTDAIIAVSQSTEQHLLQAGIPLALIQTIPNGIDTHFYQPISTEQKKQLRQQHGLSMDDFILVSSAGTADCKNWPSLIAAIAALPAKLKNKINVIIAGKTPLPQQMQAIHPFNLNAQIIFTGLLADTRQWMRLGDVGFVLSNAEETISFACREMMAMGLPVIVSNYGGLPENVTDEVDGWIVPVNDIPALTQCLVRLLKQTDLTPIAQHARERAVKHFDKAVFIQSTLKLYQRLINLPLLPRQ